MIKTKFTTLTILLLFARGCDFYSTSLWFFQSNGISDETNPLTRFLGAGWNGLILTNIILVGLIIGMFYYYSFKYQPHRVSTNPSNYKEYASSLYFGRNDRFWQIFYKIPKNPKILIGHLGYVLVRVLIVGSILATVHNLCQFHNVAAYDGFREIVIRPLYVIYGVIAFSTMFFYRRILKKEYQMQQLL